MNDELPIHSRPRPERWMWTFYLMACLSALGICLALIYGNTKLQPILISVGSLVFFISLMCAGSYAARSYGLRVERNAIELLKSVLPQGWRLSTGLPTGDGDLDVLVIGFDGARYAIEIKSQKNVRTTGWFSKKLKKTDGKKFKRDPLAQAISNAKVASAQPMLWFPESKWKGISQIDSVKLVFGGKKYICKALGIKRFRWLF